MSGGSGCSRAHLPNIGVRETMLDLEQATPVAVDLEARGVLDRDGEGVSPGQTGSPYTLSAFGLEGQSRGQVGTTSDRVPHRDQPSLIPRRRPRWADTRSHQRTSRSSGPSIRSKANQVAIIATGHDAEKGRPGQLSIAFAAPLWPLYSVTVTVSLTCPADCGNRRRSMCRQSRQPRLPIAFRTGAAASTSGTPRSRPSLRRRHESSVLSSPTDTVERYP